MPSQAELAVLLKLHDEFSGKMAAPTKAVEGFGTTIAKVSKLTASFLAASTIEQGVKSLFRGVGSLVDKSRESAQVQAQTNAVLKSTGGIAGVTGEQVSDLAQKYQQLTRFSDEEVQSAENLLLTFTRIGRDIFPEATATVLDMATALGEDTKSASIQLGKALQDPINGVTALRRVGVAFTEDQQKQIKTLVESGHGMEAQRLILAELKKEFGGSAQAMTPFEKKLDSIKDFSEEAQESLGFMVQGGLLKVSDWIDEHGDDIADFVSQFDDEFAFLETEVGTRVGGIVASVGSIAKVVGDGVDLVDDIIHGEWQEAWRDFKKIGLDTGKLLVNGLAALFGTIPNLFIDAINLGLDQIRGLQLPEEISTHIFGSVHLPGGGSKPFENLPPVPRVPTQVFTIKDITDEAQHLEKAGRAGTEAVKGLNTELDDFGDKADKADDSLKKFLESMGQAVNDFLQMTGVNRAVSALFGATSREQADLRLAKLTEEERRARFGEKSVHFGPGEGPGVTNPEKLQKQLDLIDKRNELRQAEITAADALLITEGQRETEAGKLRDLMAAQSGLIKDKLNPSISDLFPEIRNAQTQFQTFTGLLDTGGTAVSGALLSLAQRINDYKLPTLTGKAGTLDPFLALNAFQGP